MTPNPLRRLKSPRRPGGASFPSEERQVLLLWLLTYPNQVVRKEIDGVLREVKVIGDSSEHRTYSDALSYAEELSRFWPGLVFDIVEVSERPLPKKGRGEA